MDHLAMLADDAIGEIALRRTVSCQGTKQQFLVSETKLAYMQDARQRGVDMVAG